MWYTTEMDGTQLRWMVQREVGYPAGREGGESSSSEGGSSTTTISS